MINKRNVLGKTPAELGDKDAVHVAIVACRVDGCIAPGQRVTINKYGEAVKAGKDNAVGVADPFMKEKAFTGDTIWIVLGQAEVPNVQHVWEHPSQEFKAPTREVTYHPYFVEAAEKFGVTQDQFAKAAKKVATTGDLTPYPEDGKFNFDELQNDDEFINWWDDFYYDLGYVYMDLFDVKFENYGSTCCPEWCMPKEVFGDGYTEYSGW